MLGLTMLVCVTAVGLVHLALTRPAVEHRVAAMFVRVVAFPLLLVAPFAGVLLFVLPAWTRRLTSSARAALPTVARVPDTVPQHWA